jgi:hypothetical protein
MINVLRTLTTCIAVFQISTSIAASPGDFDSHGYANVTTIEKNNKRVYFIECIVYVKNNKDRVVYIPSGGFTNSTIFNETHITEILKWKFEKTRDGASIIPPLSTLAVVPLGHNQVAKITWNETTTKKERLNNVSTHLIIEKSFARHFNLFYGAIEINDIETRFLGVEHSLD